MQKGTDHSNHGHVAGTAKESVTSNLNPHKSEKSKSKVAFVAAQLEDSNILDEQIVNLMAEYFNQGTPKNKTD